MVKDIEWLREEFERITEKNIPKETHDLSDIARRFAWEGANNTLETLIEQLDEPETLSQEWIDNNLLYISGNYENYYTYGQPLGDPFVRAMALRQLLLPKQVKPVIPQYVANVVEELRDTKGTNMNKLLRELNVYEPSSTVNEATYKYFNHECTFNEVLEILKGNYIIEEPKFYIELPTLGYINLPDGQEDFNLVKDISKASKLTRLEIDKLDNRFWPFRKEIEER